MAQRQKRLTEADLRYLRDRYLENASYADHLLGRLLALLDAHGRYKEALIVLLSDHGEAFHEHGRFLHSPDVHNEVLHVPLIVKWPESRKGFRPAVDGPVSLVDLLPTLVDGLSLEGGVDGYQGRSLLAASFEGERGPRPLYAVTRGHHNPDFPPRPHLMLESDGWRLLHRPVSDESRLFQVGRDPAERHDLSARFVMRTLLLRQAVRMQRAWNRQLLGVERAPVDALDPAAREQLEALGYLD
jgi:arylsulfatase A-like enzyme